MSEEQLRAVTTTVLGRRVTRVDGAERTSGLAKYAGDWKIPNMLYGRVLTSTISHGDVVGIDCEKVESHPEVKAFITCLDTTTTWKLGERRKTRYVLPKRVRFVGEPVAAVAATSREAAVEAVKMFEVEYDELPAVFDPMEALKEDAPKIWPEGNLSEHIGHNRGDIDAGFKEADYVFEGCIRTHRHHNAPLETAVSLAWWEGDHLTVVASTQGIYRCREQMAFDLGIPVNHVRVISLYKGGSFGNRNNDMNYDLMAALLAKKSHRPVMVEYSRREEFTGVHGRWGTMQYYKAGVNKSGMLTALTLRAYCDVGAYTRHVAPFPYVDGVREYHNCPNISTEVLPVHTNTPGTGNMRGPAGVPGCFGLESFIDQVANDMHLNPLDFHLNNRTVLADCKFPYTSYGMEQCIRRGAELIDWRRKWHPPGKGPTRDGKRSGIGMAVCTWNAHLGKGSAMVRINSDGTVQLSVGVTDVGTGAKSAMALIAAEELGIPIENIELVWGDTDSSPFSIGESGSRTTSLTGAAVKEAAEKARIELLSRAAALLNVKRERLSVRGGLILDASDISRKIPISAVTADPDGYSIIAVANTDVEIPHDKRRLSFAAHFSEVEVDTETGMVEIKKYVAAHDSGRLVNRLTAESQVIGGVTMGLSVALFEELQIDRTLGVISNPSFWTYRILPNASAPKVDVLFIETDDPYGPKSLGEIPMVPVAPTICNAIYNATAARVTEMPMTPERVLAALGKMRD